MSNAQSLFFTHLKASLPLHYNLPQTVAQILNISLNETYKKIKGASSLSLQQLAQLCDELKFSYQYQPNQGDTITFSYPKMVAGKREMKSFLLDMLENLKAIHKLKNKLIKVTTDDIPLFYLFKYPELTAFKLHFWADSLGAETEGASLFELNDEIKKITKSLNELYLEIPSIEIWDKDTLHGSIEQIVFAYEAGLLKDKVLAETILMQLKACLEDVNSYALKSSKIDGFGFDWYLCDVLGSICYLVNGNDVLTSFNRFNTFNYLKTNDFGYCNQTDKWMDILINRSVSFSGNGAKHRAKYLKDAFSDIDRAILIVNNS